MGQWVGGWRYGHLPPDAAIPKPKFGARIWSLKSRSSARLGRIEPWLGVPSDIAAASNIQLSNQEIILKSWPATRSTRLISNTRQLAAS
jgi:hypothetical protein